MKIVDVRIDPLIDGELALPGPSFYINSTDEDWLRYAESSSVSTTSPCT
jgi:hypothetical protein